LGKTAMINFGLNSASIVAQVNFGANSASILGIFLAVAGAALYFLRTVRPELSRDQDIFFAAVGLLCGFILVFQGWRLDPILQFGQLLLVGTTVFFAVESIRLRSIATQQAKRNTPIVDDEREVSRKYSYSDRRNYQAEMDADLEPLPYEEEERPPRPRIRGSRDDRSTRDDYRDDYYDDQPPRRNQRPSNSGKSESTDKRRRTTPNSGRSTTRNNENYGTENWGSVSRDEDSWGSPETEEKSSTRRSSNKPKRPQNSPDSIPPKSRRRSPNDLGSPRKPDDDEVISTDYVPYNPIENTQNNPNKPSDLDDDDF